MGLVTLEAAKAHLRVTSVDSDEDLQMKVDQASAAIVDYLKARGGKFGVIASSTAASPTVITTNTAHGFVNGETVVLAGHLDSVPNLNGSHVVSNVTTYTFTVPIAVTTAGTGGTATVGWTIDTVPLHVQSAVLLLLGHLERNRGDQMADDAGVWEAIGRLLVRSRDPAFA